uniref:MARVEL domain-containing protein n=1 Tax=Anolis carolinensis TaxID=28377 RepID=A0A803TWI1_ANOCA
MFSGGRPSMEGARLKMKDLPKKVFQLCSGGVCGLTPKGGCVLGGAYMILMTVMYLIFEFGHLNRALYHLEASDTRHSVGIVRIIPYCYYVAIGLACVTFVVCIYFLYSVQKRDTVGLFIYLTWIIIYDITNFIIVTLTSRAAKRANFSISPLEWFGLITRILCDFIWLSFIVAFAMIIIEGRRAGRTSLRTRRVSRHVAEPPKFRLGVHSRGIV